ncbi:MAG: 50S ribosomal protein L11 methyltransferase [Gemmatimonadota bacterium]
MEPFIEHLGERGRFWLRKPRAIGNRLVLARDGSPVPGSAGDRAVVRLAVGSAFGTGGHGTTEGCLLALEKAVRGGETVLDVGTGTGILAIAARKLGAGRVIAIDIDRAACAEARRNVAASGIGAGIGVIAGGIPSVRGIFDVVVANLRTPLLVDLADEVAARLAERGTAILSGILERELHAFLPCLESRGLECLELKRIRGWMTVVCARWDAERRSRFRG